VQDLVTDENEEMIEARDDPLSRLGDELPKIRRRPIGIK